VKIDRIKNPNSLRYMLSHPPAKLLLDHESVKTYDIRMIVTDEGVKRTVVCLISSGANTDIFKRFLVRVFLARRNEADLVSRFLARFK
jgi:hypothetical protein